MAIESAIGIIGGGGWLGSAMAQAMVSRGVVAAHCLTLSGRTDRHDAVPGAHWTRDNRELVANSDIVVLSVRPEQLADIDIDARGKLVVSVMAGVSAQDVSSRTGATAVVRAIPNAAAAIGRSFTPWFATDAVSTEARRLVQALFESCGTAAEVPLESHIDYCVAMTGSGAAFPALLAEALVVHAVAQGLPRGFAEQAARSVVGDASQLFTGIDGDPAAIVQGMIDYGGTTGAALQTMLDRGFNDTVAAGLDAASAKAAELMQST